MRRRSVFVSIVAVVLLGLIAAGHSLTTNAQDATPRADEHGFVGSWRVTVTPPQGPPFLSLGTAGADGTMVVSPPPAQPAPDAPGGVTYMSTGHGAWEATGPETAIVTFVVSVADGQGNPFGTATIRADVALGSDGQTFSGVNVVTIADPAGNVVATISEPLQATRIVAEAPAMPATGTPAA